MYNKGTVDPAHAAVLEADVAGKYNNSCKAKANTKKAEEDIAQAKVDANKKSQASVETDKCAQPLTDDHDQGNLTTAKEVDGQTRGKITRTPRARQLREKLRGVYVPPPSHTARKGRRSRCVRK